MSPSALYSKTCPIRTPFGTDSACITWPDNTRVNGQHVCAHQRAAASVIDVDHRTHQALSECLLHFGSIGNLKTPDTPCHFLFKPNIRGGYSCWVCAAYFGPLEDTTALHKAAKEHKSDVNHSQAVQHLCDLIELHTQKGVPFYTALFYESWHAWYTYYSWLHDDKNERRHVANLREFKVTDGILFGAQQHLVKTLKDMDPKTDLNICRHPQEEDASHHTLHIAKATFCCIDNPHITRDFTMLSDATGSQSLGTTQVHGQIEFRWGGHCYKIGVCFEYYKNQITRQFLETTKDSMLSRSTPQPQQDCSIDLVYPANWPAHWLAVCCTIKHTGSEVYTWNPSDEFYRHQISIQLHHITGQLGPVETHLRQLERHVSRADEQLGQLGVNISTWTGKYILKEHNILENYHILRIDSATFHYDTSNSALSMLASEFPSIANKSQFAHFEFRHSHQKYDLALVLQDYSRPSIEDLRYNMLVQGVKECCARIEITYPSSWPWSWLFDQQVTTIEGGFHRWTSAYLKDTQAGDSPYYRHQDIQLDVFRVIS